MPRYFLNLNIGDFQRDTQHLNTQDTGAYLLLLMHYVARGKLPTDDEELRNITRLKPLQWKRSKPRLQKFFSVDWRQARIEGDIAKQDRTSIVRKVAGQLGGLSTAGNRRARSRERV